MDWLLAANDCRMRLRLLWRHDRYQQRVEISERGRLVPLMESLEGTSAEEWPSSPPLKEAQLVERPDDRRVALAVGMAGRSHWSASLELDAPAGQLTFDMACRVQGKPLWLGSRYRLLVPATRWGSWEIRLEGFGRLGIHLVERQMADLELGPDGVVSIVAPAASQPLPQTVRWSYALSIA